MSFLCVQSDTGHLLSEQSVGRSCYRYADGADDALNIQWQTTPQSLALRANKLMGLVSVRVSGDLCFHVVALRVATRGIFA